MRIFSNSIPKAGTHLLRKGLQLLLGPLRDGPHLDLTMQPAEIRATLAAMPEGSFVTAHLPGDEVYRRMIEELDYRAILLVRDPRDVAISSAKFIQKEAEHYLHAYYRQLPDDGARLMASIEGVKDRAVAWFAVAQPDVGELYRMFLPWRACGRNLTLRFEDLVGPAGGGSAEAQTAALERLVRHLGMDPAAVDLAAVGAGMYDRGSPTFRKGQIGDWRNHLADEHKAAVKRVAGDVLVELGYERDGAW